MRKTSKQRKRRKLQRGEKPADKNSPAIPRLQFPPGEKSGLRAVALAVAGDKNPPAIVREILQNSLDAAKAAGREIARVQFTMEEVAVKDIPGIDEYKHALEKTGEFCEQTGWPTQSRDIFQSLKNGVANKSLPVLFVSDNGMGLDSGNMEAILSDGINKKANQGAGGSYGNGHFTTFNLSDMRYLLYGGISKEDGMLASGHAILASHQNGGEVCGKDGFFVSQIRPDLLRRYDFPGGDGIPAIIRRKLETIKSEWGTGALIAILNFNYFGKTPGNDAIDLILGAAARNFFVAIQRGEIEVDIRFGDNRKTLTADNLPSVIENISPSLRRTPKFPSHEKAERFYRLFIDGEKGGGRKIQIETDGGIFDVVYRESIHASTRISLCRNGMWITDDIPMISSGGYFAEHVPFEALILCDEIRTRELVRLAEVNLHNALHTTLVENPNKRKTLKDSLQRVREHLQKIIRKQSSEFLDFVEIEGAGSIGVSPGQDTPKKERVGPAGGTGGGLGKRGNSRKGDKSGKNSGRSTKPGNRISVRFVAVRDRNEMTIRIAAKESLKSSQEAELRLVRNGGGDFTCDRPADDDTAIILKKVVCNGEECALNDDKTGVRIGAMQENTPKTISVQFESPKVRGDYRVDCEFIRREKRP